MGASNTGPSTDTQVWYRARQLSCAPDDNSPSAFEYKPLVSSALQNCVSGKRFVGRNRLTVRKVEGGYEFRHAGEKVVRAILEGSFNENPRLAPFDIEGRCVACGTSLQASYTDERFTIECAHCEKHHGRYPFPPGGLNDRTREEVVAAFDQRVRHLHCLAADGVCPECGGRMRTEITRNDPWLGTDVSVIHRCVQCRHTLHSTVGLSLLDHSVVVAFHREHGVSLCETPYWEFGWCVDDEYVTVRSVDPWEIEVTIPLHSDRLYVALDGNLTVINIERDECASTETTQTA